MVANEFFDSIKVLPFNSDCGEISAKIITDLIKRGKITEQNDCFIASVIKKNGIDMIITKNKKHFSIIEGVKVSTY